jgi:lysophospholipase L1-like esterase
MKDTPGKPWIRSKRIIFAMIPSIALVLVLLGIELVLQLFDFPKTTWKDLFDHQVLLQKSPVTGFELKTDIRFGLDKRFSPPEPGVISIGCFGDSTTFGSGDRPENSYPSQLQRLFDGNSGQPKVKIYNFGVPSFTSEQGQRQYFQQLATFMPNIILIGYGFNDSQLVEVADRHALDEQNAQRQNNRISRLLQASRLIKIVRLGMNQLPFLPHSSTRRVSLEEYRQNLTTILMNQLKRGGGTILLNMEFANNFSHGILPVIASDFKVPYINFPLIFNRELQDRSATRVRALGLNPVLESASKPGKTILRVLVEKKCSDLEILVRYQATESFNGNKMVERLCRDDGIFPDEKANDCVFSTEIESDTSLPIHYLFFSREAGVDAAEFPAFSEIQNPLRLWHTRVMMRQEEREDAESLSVFGQRPLMSEKIHPHGEGYRIIAETLFPVIRGMPQFIGFQPTTIE